jgi:hypothetical protein
MAVAAVAPPSAKAGKDVEIRVTTSNAAMIVFFMSSPPLAIFRLRSETGPPSGNNRISSPPQNFRK